VDTHVLVDLHFRAEEEILDVSSAVSGPTMGIRDYAVEMKFGVRDSYGGGAYVLVGVKAIAAYGDADTVDFGFAGAHCADNGGVGDLASCRDLVRADEEHGVVACDLLVEDRALFGDALGAATPFVGQGAGPGLRVRAP